MTRRYMKPVVHVRLSGRPDLLKTVTDTIVKSLEAQFELIEVTDPRPIPNDDVNQKVYVTVR